MRFVLTLVAASVGLVACGGGGDGDGNGSSNGPTPVAVQATLTPENYVPVAQEALSSNIYLLDASSLVTGAQVSDPNVLVRFGQDQLAKVPSWFASEAAQAVGASQSSTQPCDGGGTLTVVENDLNGNQQVDPGDSVSLTANNCSFDGAVLNGQLSLTVNSLSGSFDNYPYTLSATLRFTSLTAQSGSDSVVGNGSLRLDLQANNYNAKTTKLSTKSFSLSSTYGVKTYSQTLQDYETNLQMAPAGSVTTWTSSANGTLTSSAFGSKSVRIETPTPFVRSGSQFYPSSGSALITGAAGAKVRVTAVNATTVTIDLDADGNGSYETTVTKLWSEML